jgi:Calcineurin-like phosphoesterase
MRRAIAAALALCGAGAARAGPQAAVPPSPAWVTISTEKLRAGYDTLWAVSDVHGRLDAVEQLLAAAGLASRDERGRVRWTPGRARQLLVVVGDCIDGGPDSVGVVFLFRDLQAQAAAEKSRVVVLLGNHEVDFLAAPRKASPELLSSAERVGLRLGRKHGGERLAGSKFGGVLRGMPVAAFIGSWLFAHAGYVDAEDEVAVRAYFSRIASSWQGDDAARYRPLQDPRSIVSYHRWWESRRRRSAMKANLAALGLDGLVFGHDPGALGALGTVAMEAGGWLTKLDTGMKTGRSGGMLLRCDVGRMVRGTGLSMSDHGRPTCGGLTPDGALQELPVR